MIEPSNRLIYVYVRADGHAFCLLFMRCYEHIALRQVFVWAFDPDVPQFKWEHARAIIDEIEREINRKEPR